MSLPSSASDAFARQGFAEPEIGAKLSLLERCIARLDQIGGGSDRSAWFVPGRVEVLGKHTDYAGGRSMVAAVDHGIVIVSAPRTNRRIRFDDAIFGESAEFELSDDLDPTIGHWSNYPMTVARRICRDFPGASRGADIVIASDLVPASGMSSSSALIIASFFALSAANGLDSLPAYRAELPSLTELACYVAAVEGGKGYGAFRADHGVGTAGGSEDHAAILLSKPGHLGVYSYRPVRAETDVPFPAEYALVVCSSGVAAEKTGAARELYNRASRLASVACEEAAKALEVEADDLATLGRVAGYDEVVAALRGTRHREFPPDALASRFEHFHQESNVVVPAAVAALAARDLEGWSKATAESQRLAEELLGNQIPETSHLAASAKECGAVAGSAFGAGFGGSVWAMVRREAVDRFIAAWRHSYVDAFPQHAERAEFFAVQPGPASFSVPVVA